MWDTKESEFSKTVNDKRQTEFFEKLAVLLDEYKVEISLDETSRGYYTDYDIQFEFDGYRDAEADEYVSYRTITVVNHFDKTDCEKYRVS
jgi:heme-binding NEAT domain protein